MIIVIIITYSKPPSLIWRGFFILKYRLDRPLDCRINRDNESKKNNKRKKMLNFVKTEVNKLMNTNDRLVKVQKITTLIDMSNKLMDIVLSNKKEIEKIRKELGENDQK